MASGITRFGRAAVRRWSPLILLVVLVIVFAITTPNFWTVSNWQTIAVTQAVVACVALGSLLPLIVGEFDLSLGALLGFVAMVGGFLARSNAGPVVCILAMLAVGVVVGLVNAVFTVLFKLSSFVATLAISIILGGLTLGLSGGQILFENIPGLITALGQTQFLGVAICVWITVVIAVILTFILTQTPSGRRMYAIGASERVAFLAGVKTNKIKIIAFAGAGLLVAIGGIFQLGQAGGANPSEGPELLLPAYAAAFLGAVSYKVGFFNVPGTLIAIVLLAVGFNGLSLLGTPSWVQPVFNGCVLLVAVLLARAEARRATVG